MRTSRVLAMGLSPLWTSGAVWAQSGHMMDGMWSGGWMGGYGGMWLPNLLVVVLVAAVVVIVRRK